MDSRRPIAFRRDRRAMVPALMCALALLGLLPMCASAAVELRPVGRPGAYLGFDLRVDGRTLAPVRLSSNALILATHCRRSHTAGGQALRFGGLYGKPGAGLTLAANDAISARLAPGDPYPRIDFRFTIKGFDPSAWQRAAGGACPFHFLTVSLSDAEAWHQRGWLNATPLADKFPLLEDRHVGSPEIASKYSRNWGYTPPLGAQPMPVIGLWAPTHRLYVALEFQGTRLRDNSEKHIATGYCWRQGADGQFVALVYPHGGTGYQSLVFPRTGTVIASHGVLLYDANLPATDDPNRFVWQVLWARDRAYLPRSPSTNDLSWISGGSRLKDFEGPAGWGLVHGVEGKFQVPGSRLIAGWYTHKEGVVPHLVRSDNRRGVARLTEDLRYLLSKAKRFRAGGEPCVYWEKPLEGRWTDEWGGAPATTLHNSDAFAVARVWLDLYRLRDTPVAAGILSDLGVTPAQALEIVEGCLNWARHITWTRNEFADVPSSPFAIGGTLTSAFCLDYYFAFRDDPARRARAEQALDLARTFVYRYLTMWPSDNDRADRFDSAFLWEPNSGRDWCGAACANEVTWCLDTLAMTAVNTGDPILIHALRGTLDRWHLLYKERYHRSLAEYESDALTEGYALYDDTVYGARGSRAAWGWGPSLPMIEPVGESTVRVLAGTKTALAFSKRGVAATLADYACAAPGSFVFTLHCAPAGPHDLSLTFPFADLSGVRVWIKRGGERIELTEGNGLLRPPQALWSLYLSGVRDGDRVEVGAGETGAPTPRRQARPSIAPAMTELPSAAPFRCLHLEGSTSVKQDWDDLNSWPGLAGGLRWAYGIPLELSWPQPAAVARATRFDEPILGPAIVFVAYSDGAGSPPSVTLADGKAIPLDASRESLAWAAWPPIFTRRMVVAPASIPADARAVGFDTRGRLVFAVTTLSAAPSAHEPHMQALTAAAKDWRAIREAERRAAALAKLAASRELERVVILPYGESGTPLTTLLARSGVTERARRLSPEELAAPGGLDPTRLSVAFDLDGENYIKTVKAEGDAAQAIVRFVQGGALLVLATDAPYPMYYGRTPQGAPSDPLPNRLGLPVTMGFERPPAGERITLVANARQDVLTGIPSEVAFPSGDQRLRAVDRTQVPAGATYTPIYTARGSRGADYGDAACLIEFPGGGRVLYVWFGLMRDRAAGPAIAEAVFRYVVATLPPRAGGR